MAKVVFDPAHFKEIYPQFAGMSDTQLEWFFKKSEQILDNSENSCIDEDTRLIWFYLLVAHYAELQTQIQSGNSAVGRISSATEGSVSVSLDYPTSSVGREKWFNQTPYGAEYWMMTAPYRTGLYVVTNIAMPVDRSRYPQPRWYMVKRSGEGLANYLKKLAPESTGAHVKVGVLENSKYPDGTPVPLVAFWNEYGTRTAPPRPFFRDTIEQNKKNWSDMTLRGIGRGLPVTEILGLVGLQMQTDIQTAIMTFDNPPNAASTVAKKGTQSPLRESLLLYDSIKSEVVEEWNLTEMESNLLHESAI